jgi:Flp pilus assembly protein TadG
MRRLRRERLRDDSGATAVEFALIFPVVLMVSFFVLYGAMYFYYSAVAGHVARTVTRQVSIPVGQTGSGYPAEDTTSLMSRADNVGGTMIPNASDATAHNQGNDPTPEEGDLVTVTITYNLPVMSQLASVIPGLSAIDTISQSATERRQ